MAIQNSFSVYINGINLTHYVVVPLKWGNFLDEQLDEMYLSLRHGPFANIKPLSPVEIHLSNRLYWGNTTENTKEQIKCFIVANDNSEESPIGSKRYNHDLYLIEITKLAECIVVDTLTFTNDFGRNYIKNAVTTIVEQQYAEDSPPHTPNNYKSPIPTGNFTFVGAYTIFPYTTPASPGSITKDTYRVIITDQYGNELFDRGTENIAEDTPITLSLTTGVTYNASYRWISQTRTAIITSSITYAFVPVENYYPLKQWTITDVINRLLDLAEPLRQGERPRFILQGIDPSTGAIQANSQAARFDKILAPQFSFTKQTLRECLKEIGGVVHGEPRLDIAQDSEGNYYYEVSFDLYGQTDRAGIWAKPYIQKTVSQVIDSYASCLDSNAENLVNQLDKLAGVIVEPYSGGYKTVRTETIYARITDANMLIQTQYPIYTIEKLESAFIPNNTSIPKPIDITPYVFESSIYNTRLSSYAELYPYSKAFGITYTQGQKNLTALNFKVDDAFAPAFKNYAIVNILRSATGNQSLNITDYPLLAFRVTYTPFYNSRVGQTKVNYKDYPYAAALIYNQQSNVIESRYYGENLKGVIARLGNVDKSLTYNLARLSDIPKAGQMYDEDYYISTVAVEFLPTYIKCTIGLSKDFNRLSQYIGVSSVKRYSEVSQGQAVERNTLWKEYIVIGDEEDADEDCDMQFVLGAVRDTFLQTGGYKPITCVTAYGGTFSQAEVETERKDITAQTSVSYNNSNLTITATTTAQTEQRITVRAHMVYRTTNGQDENDLQFTFYGTSGTVNAADYVTVSGELQTILSVELLSAYYDEPQYPLPLVTLPVISSAFGNSIAFSWAYEDNYSAGAISQYASSADGSVTGYFQNNYQYTDYYGRMYYYNFALQAEGELVLTYDQQKDIGTSLPEGDPDYGSRQSYIASYAPRVLRKDNREAMQCNFQVDFVSNRKGLIIGSALAAYSPLVRGEDSRLAAKLYIFDETLDKFINHVEGSTDIDLSEKTGYPITLGEVSNGKFALSAAAFAISGKSWAIVTNQYKGEAYMVEDEEGVISEQQDTYGGDVLLAQNMDISAGQAFTPIYFTKKREVFDKTVWKANR